MNRKMERLLDHFLKICYKIQITDCIRLSIKILNYNNAIKTKKELSKNVNNLP